MAKILLDTIVFDHLTRNPNKISNKAFELIRNPQNELYLSVVSLWELSNHVKVRKFAVNGDFSTFFKSMLSKLNITLLPITWEAMEYMAQFDYVYKFADLPHKDTFDRMIIAHALTDNMIIVSPDNWFPFYAPLGLKVLW